MHLELRKIHLPAACWYVVLWHTKTMLTSVIMHTPPLPSSFSSRSCIFLLCWVVLYAERFSSLPSREEKTAWQSSKVHIRGVLRLWTSVVLWCIGQNARSCNNFGTLADTCHMFYSGDINSNTIITNTGLLAEFWWTSLSSIAQAISSWKFQGVNFYRFCSCS